MHYVKLLSATSRQNPNPKPKIKTQAMTRLTSDELRHRVSRAVPGHLQFGECSKPDGCFHACVEGTEDCFDVTVNLAEFIAAQYGVPRESVRLIWDSYTWRYSAEF